MSGARLFRATTLLALANALALGIQFLTTVLIAREFGISAQMDAYALAISIPESLQYVLLLASLSIIFTPLFIAARDAHGESEAWSVALSLLLLVAGAMLVVIPLLWAAMPWAMYVLAPGFAPETRALAVELARFILPALLYYATAGLLLGICFAYHDFTTATLNTILFALLNLVGFFLFVQIFAWGVFGLMAGRLAALGILEIFLLARVLRLKREIPARIHLRHPQVRMMLSYLPPYTFGALSGQLQLIVSRSLVSTLGGGSVAAWGYGQRLADIPMAVVGGAFGTTFLPSFAERVSANDRPAARTHWNNAILRMALLLAPVAALLVAQAVPLITVLFQRGSFDARSTQESALVLTGLALGLPARGIGALVARGLPAFKTRRVPLLLSALATALIIAFAFLFIAPLGLFGVALATALGETAFALAGMFVFARWLGATYRANARGMLKIFLAAGAVFLLNLAVVAWLAVPLMQVLVGGALGALLYIALGYAFRIAEIRMLPQIVVNTVARWRARA